MSFPTHFIEQVHWERRGFGIMQQSVNRHFLFFAKNSKMSIECGGFNHNIIYCNFSQEGQPDEDNVKCEVERTFNTPLVSKLSKYLVSVSRFSCPLHTVNMNDHIESAIVITTFGSEDAIGGRVVPACVKSQLAHHPRESPKHLAYRQYVGLELEEEKEE